MAPQRVVIVGGGFAGFETARSLLVRAPHVPLDTDTPELPRLPGPAAR